MSHEWPNGAEPELSKLLDEYLRKNPYPRVYDKPMAPPWKFYPELADDYMGWRMGAGEDYLIAFREWFETLSGPERAGYAKHHPEHASWEGFYRGFRQKDE